MQADLIILGGGPAGYRAAEKAAKGGLSVILIEATALGGVCLNEGCIPTKTLLYSAKLAYGAAHGEKYGITADCTIDHKTVLARKDKVVRTLVAGVKAALKNANVTVVNGHGIIAGKDDELYKVEVENETYTAPRLLICTGSNAVLPRIPGIDAANVITSREALTLEQVPSSLAVVGGGVIGLELASYYSALGCRVTVVEALDHIAGETDRDISENLMKNCQKRGMSFLLSERVVEVTEQGLRTENGFVEAEKVLVSVGRRPNTNGIGLENIGLATERGAIVTDAHMRTALPNVWAAGDVNGKIMLAHTAYREADVAVADMLGKDDSVVYEYIPSVIYTNPEVASVGETEASASAKGIGYRSVKLPMRFSGRYIAENEGGDGLFKLLCDKDGRIIGASAVANYSSEFIAALTAFVTLGTTVSELKKIVFPHPTVGEIIRDAADALDE